MERSYQVGTRASTLALKQAAEVIYSLRKFYPALKVEIDRIDTPGDRDKLTPISQIEGSDFFTRELDEAVLEGRVDFAVHSAKDLPVQLRPGLTIAAITASEDKHDVLVCKSGLNLAQLPYGARIGTSSLRRKQGLKKFRRDFQIVDIRGNIEERLQQLDCNGIGNLDAIVIAACGLIRLGLEQRITQRIPFEILKPHPWQGSLGLVARAEGLELIRLLSVLDYKKAIPA